MFAASALTWGAARYTRVVGNIVARTRVAGFMSRRFGNSSAMPNLIRNSYRGAGHSGSWNNKKLRVARLGWSVAKKPRNSTFRLALPWLPKRYRHYHIIKGLKRY
jgi:hypothetical protein